MSDEDDGPEYAEITPEQGKAPDEYTYIERRAELYRMIEDAGHPRNLRRNQRELAARYDVSQPMISKDMTRLREYQRERSGNRAVSTSRWLAEKVVTEIIAQAERLLQQAEDLEEAGNVERAANLRSRAADLWSDAMEVQMEYNDFLFELGSLEKAPDELLVEGEIEAGDLYMEMLRREAEESE